MRQPTFKQFSDELKKLIDPASADTLKNIIYQLAKSVPTSERREFLDRISQLLSGKSDLPDEHEDTEQEFSPEELFKKINEYRQKLMNGEFYDEAIDYDTFHRSEYRRYDRYGDYDDEDIDFSNEEYVLEMEDMLNDSESFFYAGDITTALKAYDELFDIMESEEYETGEYFIYGFSFPEAIEESIYHMHKISYLRLYYLNYFQKAPEKIFNKYSSQDSIKLSDIVDGDTTPLPAFKDFLTTYIQFLSAKAGQRMHAVQLVDAIFVKSGIEGLKKYAYEYGEKIPAVFLAYFEEIKETDITKEDLVQLLTDGIEMIPERYASRSVLSKELVHIARDLKDEDLLLKGYSTAFYSYPDIKNLNDYLGFISDRSIGIEIKKLENYLMSQKGECTSPEYWDFSLSEADIYSSNSGSIDEITFFVADVILHGIESWLPHIDENIFLGFSNKHKRVPIIISFLLTLIAGDKKAVIIQKLMNHYCFNDVYHNSDHLKKYINKKLISLELSESKIRNSYTKSKLIAVKRVKHILDNKLRGGYESACLLLVSCAEAKQILDGEGNRLIMDIDTRYKRFTAFRRELKALTAESHLLSTVT
jgi:hypothetical protein